MRPLLLLLLAAALPGEEAAAAAGPAAPCEAGGRRYSAGERFVPPGEPCSRCECTARGPACARAPCPALPPACIHVSRYPAACCPRCERVGCEHRGRVYGLGQRFQPSECEQCTCDPDGIARCLVADCAPPPCVNAVYETGQCCPTCQDGPNCYADRSRTRVIPAGEVVWVEPCTRCRCHDGQDAGYWEGNRVAKCELLRNCGPLDRRNS
ncbi:von Willebrand factor C domain-containing protein 2-like [Emys orbicularis]|uniref:von Willebrand factor C domain-containing protein 2-like n=1 Tax=Emys orbicularis TaxID=82168 RepID=UPI0031FD3DE9